MDFLTLSLPEATFLYLGFAVWHDLRVSPSLLKLPAIIMVCWTLCLLWRASGKGFTWGSYQPVMAYVGVSVAICVLFWPESLKLGGTTRVVNSEQVGSYAASQDEGATIVTAADTRLGEVGTRSSALIPPAAYLLVRAITGTFVEMGRAVNNQSHRPFSSLMPWFWLLGTELTADLTSGIADWVHACYLPVVSGVMAVGDQARTAEELLPWEAGPVRDALATRAVPVGAQTGLAFFRAAGTSDMTPCNVYLLNLEFATGARLYEATSPKGTRLLQVFQEELGMNAQQQARFLVYREILRAAGPAVPAPSLAAQYAGLRGLSVAGQALGSGAVAGVAGWFKGLAALPAALFGAGAGVAKGLGGEFQRIIDGLTWIVGLAVFLTWWSPYILGMANLVILGYGASLTVVLCLLLPGQQLQLGLTYLKLLAFTCSASLWWALVDLVSRHVASLAPQSSDAILGLGNGAMAAAWSAAIVVIGVFVIPAVISLILGVRAGMGLYRSVT